MTKTHLTYEDALFAFGSPDTDPIAMRLEPDAPWTWAERMADDPTLREFVDAEIARAGGAAAAWKAEAERWERAARHWQREAEASASIGKDAAAKAVRARPADRPSGMFAGGGGEDLP